MKKYLFAFVLIFVTICFVKADEVATLGNKIVTVDEIKDGGLYAIYGLLDCDPINGVAGSTGGFYKSGKCDGVEFNTANTFMFTSTGDGDGTFYIHSLFDGCFWSSCQSEEFLSGGEALFYRSMAAKVKFVPNENASLPGSFVIYEYISDANRDINGNIVSAPYVIAQDWGRNFGWCAVPSLADNEKNGSGEWYIYEVSMDTPNRYMLSGLIDKVSALKLQESPDPGKFADLGTVPEVLEQAKQVVDSISEPDAEFMVEKFLDALDEIAEIEPNSIVDGIYVVENGYNGFYGVQKVTKSLCLDINEYDDVSGDYALYWRTSPKDIFAADSIFYFELLSAENSEIAKMLVEDGAITEEQKSELFFLRNPETGWYVSWTTNRGIAVGSTKEPVTPYLITPNGEYYTIVSPEMQEYGLSPYNHLGGNGPDNFVEYALKIYQASIWRLRLVKDYRNTAISAVKVKNDSDVISVTYYTICGVASDVPVKGINIVKYIYADGSVETKKIVAE